MQTPTEEATDQPGRRGVTTGSDAAHVVGDQSAVIDFLSAAETYGLSTPPLRIDTHGAVVFLAGGAAYKLKRAVKFPFMDLSTLAKRKAACEAEIAVNAPNAPMIYAGVVPVTRDGDALRIGGTGEPVEWLVHMRRFDEQRTLDRVAERGGLTPPLLASLVRAVLASHERAPKRDGVAAAQSLQRYLQQNADAFAENRDLFASARADRLTKRSNEVLDRISELLLERGRAGHVRRCHGDLHLRNIVLIADRPTLFDAVEFDDAIATGDVLYDLAFLLMDLWERALRSEANLVMNRYLWGSREDHLRALAALPLFLSIRAAIRAKVIAASIPHLDADKRAAAVDARRYFDAAEAFLEDRAPRLIAIGGLSGSGKTTLAAAIAAKIGAAPGAVHLRSDIERKVLAGVRETERLPETAYTKAASDAVYAALRRKAKRALKAGSSVVVDAVHALPAEREAIAATAREAGVPFAGLWLEAPTTALVDRVRAREGDASDATAEVVQTQLQYELGPIDWTRISTGGGISAAAAQALDALAAA